VNKYKYDLPEEIICIAGFLVFTVAVAVFGA